MKTISKVKQKKGDRLGKTNGNIDLIMKTDYNKKKKRLKNVG
ncbi:hypothetical protein AR1Y2_0241 [Anaerostipes rhamnosivorans]|uniref:Uncharacterized protein n=1 Tax=Anaerostipes rhamnosivorans TaxID=1229621 RepID=A0A4P8IAL9_9FIRM|nr:hypothetical protein AR1Y2_0241 [Anaerostipes rhamnosivorans]